MALLASACCRESTPVYPRKSPLTQVRTRRLENIAYHDNLTGLPNHRAFCESLESQLVAARDDRFMLSIVLIDIDHFSEINDAYGQQGGNNLLAHAAKRMSSCLPTGGGLARWGSDEFILMVRNQPRHAVEQVIDKLHTSLSRPFLVNDAAHSITACTGVVATDGESVCVNDLLGWVEQALHSAKQSGRGKLCWFSDEMRTRHKRRTTLAQELQDVTGRQELQLLYQPIVCCESQTVQKAECLLRWQHPASGFDQPGRIYFHWLRSPVIFVLLEIGYSNRLSGKPATGVKLTPRIFALASMSLQYN